MSRSSVILGTAGHIDHGKTSLVRALTGIDTDRLPQEKERGITIDLGFAHLDLDGRRIGIVDVPGHERFVRNMLAGASGVDVAMLVIAADDSIMPQTREHFAILQLLGVRRGVIALTKIDRVEPDWVELVAEDVRELVAGSFLEDAPIVPTSATAGDGIEALREAIAEAVDAVEASTDDLPFRIAVDRTFVGRGVGTIITGTVWSGEVAVGDSLDWLPGGGSVTVRGLQAHGQAVERVERGQRAAIQVSGAHHEDVGRGDEFAAPGYLAPSRCLSARCTMLPEAPWPLRHRGVVRLHVGTAEVAARVRILEGTTIDPGEQGWVQLHLTDPVSVVNQQPFVLRAESPVVTLGGGTIVEPVTHPAPRRRARVVERLAERANPDEALRLAAAIASAGVGGLAPDDVPREAALSGARARERIASLIDDGTVVTGRDGRLRHCAVRAEAEDRVLAVLRQLHEASPLESRHERTAIAVRLGRLGAESLDDLVGGLLESGRVVGDERAIALADFGPELDPEQRRLCDAIEDAFRDGGLQPPSTGDVATACGVKDKALRPLLDLCVSGGRIVHIGGGTFLHGEVAGGLPRALREAFPEGRRFTMSELRDALGTTRKFAVPIGEYLDRAGLTRRIGDERVLTEKAVTHG